MRVWLVEHLHIVFAVALTVIAVFVIAPSIRDIVEGPPGPSPIEVNLEAIQKKIDKNFETIDANFDTLFEADKILSGELKATRARTDNAHTRIEYYRDVLLIVSKTCPSRMRLPVLGGDPKQ